MLVGEIQCRIREAAQTENKVAATFYAKQFA
jgi:hypothetical protein